LHCPGCIELLVAAVIALGAEYCQGSKDGIQFMQGLGIAKKLYISEKKNGAEAPSVNDLGF
jgi:hypothetical protein